MNTLARSVTAIPATKKPGHNVTACNPLFKRKVAAYAQVSTNLEEQATSLSS